MQQHILMNDPPGIRSDDFHKILKIAFGREQKGFDPETGALNDPACTTKVSAAEFTPIEWQGISVVIDVDFFDNATPSGNSVAADVLLRMAAVLDRKDYRDYAARILAKLANFMRQYPTGFGRALAAADFYLGPSKEIAIIGDPRAFLPKFRKRYLPRAVFAGGSSSDIALLRDRPMVEGKPTVYVCENFTCKKPVTDPDTFDAFDDGLE